MNGLVFSCNFEELQKKKGMKPCLAAKEVVHYIFDADFQKYNLYMYDNGTDALFTYTYVKKPRDGMFLMEVENLAEGYCLLVLIDTKTKPDFISVEKTAGDKNQGTRQVVRVLQNAINGFAHQFGWKVNLIQNKLDEVIFPDEFARANGYIKEYEDERDRRTIKYDKYEDFILVDDKFAVLKLTHELCDGNTSAKFVIGVQYDMLKEGILSDDPPVSLKIFQDEFGKGKGRKRSSYSDWLGKKSYMYENDSIHKKIRRQFREIKEREKK